MVVAFLGDGAYMFANPTACHWMADEQKLPVLTIVYNNALYNAVRRATLDMYPHSVAAGEDGRRLAELATAPPSSRWSRRMAAMASASSIPRNCPPRCNAPPPRCAADARRWSTRSARFELRCPPRRLQPRRLGTIDVRPGAVAEIEGAGLGLRLVLELG